VAQGLEAQKDGLKKGRKQSYITLYMAELFVNRQSI
jgi:hypothetical protein